MTNDDGRFSLKKIRPSCNVLGIDLGTTNTVVALWMAGKPSPEVLTVENNERIIPSYVWCKADGTFDVGKNAVRNLKQFPQDVCYDAKRMIGQCINDSMILQSDYWSFEIINENGRPFYELSNGRKISPEEITTQILKKAKDIAENYVGTVLQDAVITVPVCFNQTQKHATLEAAKKAGLNVLQLESEPNAAAYASHYNYKRGDDYNLFVFDLGGGNFNVTAMSIKNETFIVRATSGDNNLGGRDFDNLLMKELIKRLEKQGAQNLDSVKSKIRFWTLAEATKVALSSCDKEIVNCNDFIDGSEKDGAFEITRAEFEHLSKPLKSALKDACLKALTEAKMKAGDFNNIILVGSSSRMTMISELISQLFPQSKDFCFDIPINGDEVVAYGAAIRAAQLSDPSYKHSLENIVNCLPIGLGIGLIKNQYSLVIKSGTHFPTTITRRYYTTENNQTAVIIIVYEGERNATSQNQEILSFTVPNLPPGLAGDIYVDVTFSLDKNGLLTVTAKSPTSSAEETIDYQKIRQTGKPIKQLFKELAIYPKNDKQKKILIEARAELRSNVENIKKRYQNEKNFPHNKKQIITDNCNEVLEWLDENPDETLNEETINLAKQIERDTKELIDLRLMIISG